MDIRPSTVQLYCTLHLTEGAVNENPPAGNVTGALLTEGDSTVLQIKKTENGGPHPKKWP